MHKNTVQRENEEVSRWMSIRSMGELTVTN